MSRTLFFMASVTLNVLFVLDVVNAKSIDPPSCTDFPKGCTCTTQNATDGVYVSRVSCLNLGLTEVPADFITHTKVQSIDLQGNMIRKIRRKEFAMLTQLDSLDLSNNLIDEIEEYSFNATKLRKLFLQYNLLSTLPDNLLNPENKLNILQLSANRFTEIPSTMLHNSVISTLHLSMNQFRVLSDFAFAKNGSYSHIEDLYLIKCNIVDIANYAFSGLRELQHLDLDYNQLRRLSKSMLEHVPESLRLFSARHNKIEIVDQDAFSKMKRAFYIYLDFNRITTIEADTFEDMQTLTEVSLDENQISNIHKKAFRNSRISSLYLSWNRIDALHPEIFRKQDNLVEIYLAGNRLVLINPKIFSRNNVPHLQVLDLGYNEILEIPKIESTSLLYYHLEVNNITYADHDAFVGVPNVRILKLSHNQMEFHNDTLKPLKQLRELIIRGNHFLQHLPSLEYNSKLKSMDIEHCSLQELPEDLCTTCPQLRILSVYSNYLTHVPKLQKCTDLDTFSASHNEIESLDNLPFDGLYYMQILEMNNNRITSLPSNVFKDLGALRDLYLEHNSIGWLPNGVFQNKHHMEFLNLSYNQVWELQSRIFHDLDLVNEMYLKNMGIHKISEHAFPDNMSHLLILDLSDNHFNHLPIPKSGWPELRYLYLYNVPSLYRAPGPNDCPKLQGAGFTYAYHCCAFESRLPEGYHEPSSPFNDPVIAYPSNQDVVEDSEPVTTDPNTKPSNHSHVCDFLENVLNITNACPKDLSSTSSPTPPTINRTAVEIIRHLRVVSIPETDYFVCYPQADPMMPCEDLLGSWILRVLIWVVFVVTLFGNGLVLTVILASPKPPRRLGPPIVDRKVSQFYISQLAVADIGIGIYLGFLAVVDLQTFGKQEFYQMALSWQYGPGCLTAGFIAILSSELSVYILVVITLERIYVYKHAMVVTKMHMCNAILIILFGWLFAGACATLPLVGFNTYTSVAICLPFDVVSTRGRFYIAILMGINLLAFLVVAACNFYLYCRLGKLSSITTSDSKMFRMVFILIITDFLCWAPLVTVSLAALFRQDLINTSAAKWFAVLVLPINACANPFLYGLLTEKFKHQMQDMCHGVKRILPGHHGSGIRPPQQRIRRNSIALGEVHRPSYSSSIGLPFAHSLGQNSPGSMSSGSISSSSAPFLGRRASLPALGTEGLRIGSPRGMVRFLPTPFTMNDHENSDSMPELTATSSEHNDSSYYPFAYPRFVLEKPVGKGKSSLATVKEQATESTAKRGSESSCELETVEEVTETNDESFSGVTVLDKVSTRVHHSSDECSRADSSSLGIGSSVQGTDEDSRSITSLCLEVTNSSNNGQPAVVCMFDETDV